MWRLARQRAVSCMKIAEPRAKCESSRVVASELLRSRGAPEPPVAAEKAEQDAVPLQPGRLATPKLVDRVPSAGKLGVSHAVHILHAVAHVELNAVDMYWDTLARFAPLRAEAEFVHDLLSVVDDESRHFLAVDDRLRNLGSFYGALPAHGVLWRNALQTRHDLEARLVLVPLVQEARGLDAGPRLVHKLKSEGDEQSAALLQMIVDDEVRHVGVGAKWFRVLCREAGVEPRERFHQLVAQYSPMGLQAPFNVVARAAAAMDEDWYAPMAAKSASSADSRPLLAGQQRQLPQRTFGSDAGARRRSSSAASSDSRTASSASSAASPDSPLAHAAVVVASLWPQPRCSAAGFRTASLMQVLRQEVGLKRVVCASAAAENEFSRELQDAGYEVRRVRLNSDDMALLVKEVRPRLVLFDRFVMEEQYGWQVRQALPEALRVLDTQDLHCLRQARERSLGDDKTALYCDERRLKLDSSDENALRELASIHRSDLSLVVSDHELSLLTTRLGVPRETLALATFFFNDDLFESIVPLRRTRREAQFAMLGNFIHPPNKDSVRYMHERLWPRIRRELPQAELRVYGAYPTRQHMELDSRETGFIMDGPVKNHFKALGRSVALLAPLRFGAGIKGKIADSWLAGTPVVTTPIGAEGMGFRRDAMEEWGGCVAESENTFVRDAVRMMKDNAFWTQLSNNARKLAESLYSYRKNAPVLGAAIARALDQREARRRANFTGAVLWDSRHRHTEYFARWLQLRSRSP